MSQKEQPLIAELPICPDNFLAAEMSENAQSKCNFIVTGSLPNGWIWISLGNIFNSVTKGHKMNLNFQVP